MRTLRVSRDLQVIGGGFTGNANSGNAGGNDDVVDADFKEV